MDKVETILGALGFIIINVLIIIQIIRGFVRQFKLRKLRLDNWSIIRIHIDFWRYLVTILLLLFFTLLMVEVWRETNRGKYLIFLYPLIGIVWILANNKKIALKGINNQVLLFENGITTIKKIDITSETTAKLKIDFTPISGKTITMRCDQSEKNVNLINELIENLVTNIKS